MNVVQGSLASEDRLDWLQARLDDEGSVRIAAAAEALGVSEMTIRRDLTELEERGSARRFRGGARAVGPQPVAQRQTMAVRAKTRIAAKLADLIPASGTIALDASTTVLRAVAGFDAARDLIVVTNGPDTFAALQDKAGTMPLLTGGKLDLRTGSLVGPLACRSASQLVVDRFFTSAAAVDPVAGSVEATLDEAEVKRALAASAGEVVLAIDASKLVGRASAVAVEWDRVDILVTDLEPADQRLDPFRHLAVLR